MIAELRKPYHGDPPRPWIPVRLVDRKGRVIAVNAVADTGSPFPLVTREKVLRRCRVRDAMQATTNFGILDAGWAEVRMPDLQFSREILVYGSDHVADVLARSAQVFDALVGLPFLRMFEYGGNDREFWLRPGATGGAA